MNSIPLTDMLKDYTDSITTIHDEMMIGMSYNNHNAAFAQEMLGRHTDTEMRKLAQDIIDA